MRGPDRLENFGRPGRETIFDPSLSFGILIAFIIPLFIDAFKNIENLDIFVSQFAGTLVLLFFFFYALDSSERITNRWFSLARDREVFPFYVLIFGAITVALMNVLPEYWSFYLSALFMMVTVHNYATRRRFIRAFRDQYESVEKCTDSTMVCLALLSQNMTFNSLAYGFFPSVIFSMLITWLYQGGDTWSFLFEGHRFTMNANYVIITILYSLLLVVFWNAKVTRGTRLIAEKIEQGDVKFFQFDER